MPLSSSIFFTDPGWGQHQVPKNAIKHENILCPSSYPVNCFPLSQMVLTTSARNIFLDGFADRPCFLEPKFYTFAVGLGLWFS